jgi:hypothetical protein
MLLSSLIAMMLTVSLRAGCPEDRKKLAKTHADSSRAEETCRLLRKAGISQGLWLHKYFAAEVIGPLVAEKPDTAQALFAFDMFIEKFIENGKGYAFGYVKGCDLSPLTSTLFTKFPERINIWYRTIPDSSVIMIVNMDDVYQIHYLGVTLHQKSTESHEDAMKRLDDHFDKDFNVRFTRAYHSFDFVNDAKPEDVKPLPGTRFNYYRHYIPNLILLSPNDTWVIRSIK